MQPIAVNIEVLNSLISCFDDYKNQREFHKLVENFEKFHIIYFDKRWLNTFNEFRESIKNDNIRKLVDDLISPKNLKYEAVEINNKDDYLTDIARVTPEQIGLHTESCRKKELRFYNLTCFNSNEFDSQNYLFRLPKTVTFKPYEKFEVSRLFAPYVRDANKLEFCDPYLFKNTNAKGEIEFLIKILELSDCIGEVIFHCELNPLNLNQKKIEEHIKTKFKKRCSCQFSKYNLPPKNVNHDRFIIVNKDKFSIRFTTSFNNLILSSDRELSVKDSFLVEFSSGRKYYDELSN